MNSVHGIPLSCKVLGDLIHQQESVDKAYHDMDVVNVVTFYLVIISDVTNSLLFI